MKASKHKILLPLQRLILAGTTACGAAQNDAKISVVQNPVVSTANETVTRLSSESPPQVSPSESVKVRTAEIRVQAGESAKATVQVIVADSYRINANPASYDYLRPTELKIEPKKNRIWQTHLSEMIWIRTRRFNNRQIQFSFDVLKAR